MKKINCPNCQIPVEWSKENKYRPFCSERCRLIDLGEWASEKHAIPGEPVIEFDSDAFPPDGQQD